MSFTVVDRVLAVAFVARQLGFHLGSSTVESNPLVRALAVAFALKRLANVKNVKDVKNLLPLLLVTLTLPKFRLGLGRPDADKVTLVEHVARLVIFRRVDLKLPPQRPYLQLLWHALNHGLWERHKMEHGALVGMNASAFSSYIPLQRFDPTKPATMITFTRDPHDVEQILSDKEAFPTRGHTGFTDIVGEGLLGMKTGPQHSAHRRIVGAFLSENHLREYSKSIAEETETLLKKWGIPSLAELTAPNSKLVNPNVVKPGKRVNLYYDMSMASLDIIMKVGFGATDQEFLSQHIPEEDNHLAHALDVVLKEIIKSTAIMWHPYVPTPTWFYVRRMLAEARQLQERLFAQSLKKAEDNADGPRTMLSEMLRLRKSNDKDAAGLTDREIADELQTVRGAGHETTSNTLCWCMYLLAQNPHELVTLREEADRLIAGDIATFDEAKQLHRHLCVILETLRLYPTVPSFPREAHKDVVLKSSGFDIPAGSLVFVSQRALNRNPAEWDRPDEFVPDRFDTVTEVQMGRPVGNPATGNRFAFAPFGSAQRSCIGQRLAVVEACQILGTIIKRIDWEIDMPLPIPEVADVTLGPKKGFWVRVKPRVPRQTSSAAE